MSTVATSQLTRPREVERLVAGGHRFARRTPFVFIGNNEYKMQGLSIGERDSLNDGKLSLYVAQRPGRLGLLRFAWRALLGKLADERDFDMLTAESLLDNERHPR